MGRPQAWLISIRDGNDGDDVFDVLHGRRPIVTGCSSQKVALDVVREHRANLGERVWLEEKDGYRVEMTDQVTPVPSGAASHSAARVEHPFDPDRPARSRYLARYGKSRRPGRWA